MNKINIILFLIFCLFSCVEKNYEVDSHNLSLSNVQYTNDALYYINENISNEINELIIKNEVLKLVYDTNELRMINSLDSVLVYINNFESNIIIETNNMSEYESYEKLKYILFNNNPNTPYKVKYSAYNLKKKLLILKSNLPNSLSVFVDISDIYKKDGVEFWEVNQFYGSTSDFALLNLNLLRNKILLIKKSILIKD